jgi:glycosyltransferase involved in cell wall biosynthesis
VLALPSEDEGLPLAILEAMGCGVPVVATPVGGVPEAVVEGVTGRLVPPKQPAALASALLEILSNETYRQTLGLNARGRAEKHYSLDGHVRTTLAAYDRLLGTSDADLAVA